MYDSTFGVVCLFIHLKRNLTDIKGKLSDLVMASKYSVYYKVSTQQVVSKTHQTNLL